MRPQRPVVTVGLYAVARLFAVDALKIHRRRNGVGARLHVTRVGAGTQGDEISGTRANVVQPFHILFAMDAAFYEGDIVARCLFAHRLAKLHQFDMFQQFQQYVFAIEQRQLATFATGEIEEGDFGLHGAHDSASG